MTFVEVLPRVAMHLRKPKPPSERDLIAQLLAEVRGLSLRVEDIMATLDEVKAAETARDAKLDQLIALTDSIKTKLDELSAAGGATPEQLDELKAMIEADLPVIDEAIARDTPDEPA